MASGSVCAVRGPPLPEKSFTPEILCSLSNCPVLKACSSSSEKVLAVFALIPYHQPQPTSSFNGRMPGLQPGDAGSNPVGVSNATLVQR